MPRKPPTFPSPPSGPRRTHRRRDSTRGRAALFSLVVLGALLVSSLPPGGAASQPAAPMGSIAPATAPVPGSAAAPAARLVAGAAAAAFATVTHRPLLPLGPGLPVLPPRLALASRAPSPTDVAAPSIPSTANSFVTGANCTFEKSVATVANSPNTVDVGVMDVGPLFNGSFATPCTAPFPDAYFWSHGASAAYRSGDGGDHWTRTFLAQNLTHWLNPSDPANGSLNWGEPDVVNGGGGLLLYSDLFVQLCDIFITPCNSSAGQQAPWGIAVARSTDGGLSWAAPAQVAAYTLTQVITPPANCTGVLPGTYILDEADKPWLTANPANGVVAVGWNVFHVRFNPATCLFTQTVDVWVSVSHDGGRTWGAALRLGGPAALDVQLAVGPAPTYPLEAVFADFANSTASGYSWGFTSSNDNGTTWSAATDVGSGIVHPIPPTAAPDVFRALTLPSMDVDSNANSAHRGTVYVVWNDNRTGAQAGYPGIDFIAGPNGGSSFIAPRLISPPTTAVTEYQPNVRVDPNGTVWVDYYGVNRTTGLYDLYDILSSDGGATWSVPFRISSAPSAPGNAIVTTIGVYDGLVVGPQGAYAAWTDCRAAACQNSNFTATETARLGAVTVTTNATAPVSLTAGTFGGTATVPLPGQVGLDYGASVFLSVPAFLPYNATYVDGFRNLTGFVNATTPSTTIVYAGGATLFANYVPSPAAFIAGTVTPAVPGLALSVGGLPTPLLPINPTTDSFNVTLAGGLAYALTATAPKYVPFSHSETAFAGKTTTVNVVLNRTPGWIAGTVLPVNATVRVNGSAPVPLTSGGIFNRSVGWGWYWVNASGFGTTTSDQYVQVVPSRTRSLAIALEGGWIEGTVAPLRSSVTLTVDGHPVALNLGTFNVSALGGTHTVVATAPGYNVSTLQVRVTPAYATIVSLTLTDLGTVEGTVGPTAALAGVVLKIFNGSRGGIEPINLTSGAFRVQLQGGFVYTVNVTATEYQSYQTTVRVDPGATANVTAVKLVYIGCSTSCGTVVPPNGTRPVASLNPVLYIVAGAGGAAVVAVVAVLYLRRRRPSLAPAPSAGPAVPAPPPEELYGEGEPTTLPHLRPDGTFEGPRPGAPPP